MVAGPLESLDSPWSPQIPSIGPPLNVCALRTNEKKNCNKYDSAVGGRTFPLSITRDRDLFLTHDAEKSASVHACTQH